MTCDVAAREDWVNKNDLILLLAHKPCMFMKCRNRRKITQEGIPLFDEVWVINSCSI